jgi:hypothetical protein
MMSQWARLAVKKPSPSEWESLWKERQAALERVFGPAAPNVYHAPVPLNMGGTADVLAFPDCLPDAVVYCTADLTGDPSVEQQPLGAADFELVMCCKRDQKTLNEYAPSILSQLAPYPLRAELRGGHTMEIGEIADTGLPALVFQDWEHSGAGFEFAGRAYGLLTCVGITQTESEFGQVQGGAALLERLGAAGLLPVTLGNRQSCV